MGNCLALQEKFVQVVKTDGKILEYRAPLKVHQVLSEYPGHEISLTPLVIRRLQADANMRAGHVYYLLPLSVPSLELNQYSNTKEVSEQENHGVVRIKLLIRKQDLEEMLGQGGPVEQLILQLQNKQLVRSFKNLESDASKNFTGWKPVLPTIPEAC
ncbi:hypothetical protein DCAR_0417649 [Daucus carota subsp. sativus]|uniref:Uncharacterized protein n=1 Tax=Daucus carota subsp. sativus TaxID=79200 RepID=A0A165YU61_DAUCS|nr:PREDICTED: uncharacterized protein LOC108217455 [Daucus carota subsp. sativus]WOG98308.1 hypothetical protein DCAR_0417649 [Daucus carota subsp. sativus]